MYKFLHAADIHLDSPMQNLAQYDGAPVETLREATRKALDRMVELAIEEKVAFVLIAGDLYDGDWKDFNTPQYLRRKLSELGREGIRVFIVQGNHDAQSQMKKASRLTLPENVYLFDVKQPETVELEELSVAIHGQGFAKRDIEDDLSVHYPEAKPGWLNIGLLHTSCGAFAAHDSYAPSTVSGLAAKGYDYWALGHIHQRQVLHKDDPWIVYPGNLQGRHVNESGAKGCAIVIAEDDRIVDMTHEPCDVLRWARCEVDVSGCDDGDEVLHAVEAVLEGELEAAEGLPLAVRVVLTGATKAHMAVSLYRRHWEEKLRDQTSLRFGEMIWLEKVKVRTRAGIDKAAAMGRDDPLGQLLRSIDAGGDDLFGSLDSLRAEVGKVLDLVPPESRLDEPPLNLDDPEQLERLIEEAKELLIPLLLERGGE